MAESLKFKNRLKIKLKKYLRSQNKKTTDGGARDKLRKLED
jgi:hypothetical protein